MLRNNFLFLLMLFQIKICCSLNISIEHNKNLLTKCLWNGAIKFFQPYKTIVLSYVNSALIFELSKELKNTFILFYLEKSIVNNVPHGEISGYFVEINTDDEILKNINNLKTNIWNPRAKFIIISKNYAILHKIVTSLWNEKIINFVIIIDNKVYSWYPYEKASNCGTNVQSIKIIDDCNKIEMKLNWFENKIPNNFNRCPLNVICTFYAPYTLRVPKNGRKHNGLDFEIIETFSNKINANVTYFPSNQWGFVYYNGSSYGGLKKLYEDNYDMAIGSFMVISSRLRFFDCSAPYIQEYHSWCVPHFPEENPGKRIDFTLASYCLIIAFYVSSSFLIHYFSRKLNEKPYFTVWSNVFFTNYAFCMGNTSKMLPKTNFVRYLFVTTFIYDVFLRISYASHLHNTRNK